MKHHRKLLWVTVYKKRGIIIDQQQQQQNVCFALKTFSLKRPGCCKIGFAALNGISHYIISYIISLN